MKAEDIIYDVFEIKNALEDDHDIEEAWIMHKFANYRSLYILQDFMLNNEIRSEWLQRLRKLSVKKINSADDPAIDYTSISLGKVTLPKLVSLPEDNGIIRISGSSGILTYDLVSFDNLMLRLAFDATEKSEFGYCAKIGTDVFIWPVTTEIQAVIVAEDPMEVQVLDPTTNTMRAMTYQDEYPIDRAIAQSIILDICTKDLQLNMKSIADITNDSKHQLRVVQSGFGNREIAD